MSTTLITMIKYCQLNMPTTSFSGMYSKPNPAINGNVKLLEINLYNCLAPRWVSPGMTLTYFRIAAATIIKTGPGKPVTDCNNIPKMNKVHAVRTPAPIIFRSSGPVSSFNASAKSSSAPFSRTNCPCPDNSGRFSPNRFNKPEHIMAKKLPIIVAGIN